MQMWVKETCQYEGGRPQRRDSYMPMEQMYSIVDENKRHKEIQRY